MIPTGMFSENKKGSAVTLQTFQTSKNTQKENSEQQTEGGGGPPNYS